MNAHVRAQVERITPLTDSILQVILSPRPYHDYTAGQYLQIVLGDEVFSYSIANAPLGSQKYELHIRHSRDNSFHQLLLAAIKREGAITVNVPLGECDLSRLDPEKPIIFIAGGTGFAPINAMIEQLLAEGSQRPFELFWGARSQSDLYLDEKVLHWESHVGHFRYVALLSDTKKDTLGNLVVTYHPQDLHQWQMVISGPDDMVYHTRDILVANGVSLQQLFSDSLRK